MPGEMLHVLGCMPRAHRIVKQVCLRSCQRMEGSPALEHEFEVAVDYVLGVYGRALAHREHEVSFLAIGRS